MVSTLVCVHTILRDNRHQFNVGLLGAYITKRHLLVPFCLAVRKSVSLWKACSVVRALAVGVGIMQPIVAGLKFLRRVRHPAKAPFGF